MLDLARCVIGIEGESDLVALGLKEPWDHRRLEGHHPARVTLKVYGANGRLVPPRTA